MPPAQKMKSINYNIEACEISFCDTKIITMKSTEFLIIYLFFLIFLTIFY